MKTGNAPNVKKLSKAMRRGLAIGNERGIKRIKGTIFDYNDKGEVCGACALGFAIIGKIGVPKRRFRPGNKEQKALNELGIKNTEKNECLLKVSTPKAKDDYFGNLSVSNFVVTHNDTVGLSVDKIADKLEKCGL